MGQQTSVEDIVDQQSALLVYLEDLLQERPVQPLIVLPQPQPSAPVVTPVTTLKPVAVTQAAPAPLPDAVAMAATQLPLAEQAPLQCLLFKAGGLSLAIPLAELNGIVPWPPEELSALPGHQPWFLGVLPHHGVNVKIVDTAALIIPANRRAAPAQTAGQRPQYIVLIDNKNWGLACNNLSQIITLVPDQVRWRNMQSQRPWLAGTVIDHMCALLNGQEFAAMLVQGSHGRGAMQQTNELKNKVKK